MFKHAEAEILDQWTAVRNNFADSISKIFPISGRKRVLEIGNISYDESKADVSDIKSQQLAKDQEKTWGIPVYAEFTLKDKETGEVVNRSKQKIAVMPKMTQRDTYILSGGEYNSAFQWRLKSGIYSKIKEDGSYETEISTAGKDAMFIKESRMKIPFDPSTKIFKYRYGTNQIPLYSMLKAVDVPDEDMIKAWGEDIYKANKKKNWEADIKKMYEKKWKQRGLKVEGSDFDSLKKSLKEALNKAQVFPDTTKITLGKSYTNLNGQALLDGSVHILSVAKGEKKADDVYSLYFKHLLGLDDFISEKFGASKTALAIKSKIRNQLDRKDKVSSIITTDIFNKPLGQVFYGNALSQRPDQTNPLDILSSKSITTIMGPGGVSSEHALRNPMKTINQSQLGFIDPLHTPEGEHTGITTNLPIGVKKVGREAKALVYDLEKKEFTYKNPAEIHGNWTVSPDQVKWSKGTPIALKDKVRALNPVTHEFDDIKMHEAKYVLPSPRNLFDEATNSIPFLQNNQGNRTMTGSRQPTQGVSLKYREPPLVQVKSNTKDSFEKVYGSIFSHVAPTDGHIVDIKKDDLGNTEEIHISDGQNTHRIQTYNNFQLNDKKSFFHAEPLVKVGDKVSKGQVLADTNSTKNGVLSVGTNLNTAYMNLHGLCYEDSVAISETAAQKLTSEHLHRPTLEMGKGDIVSLNKYLSYVSTTGKKLKKEKLSSLDDGGVVKVGSIVKPGDLLVAAVGKNELTGDLSKLTSRLKGAIVPFRDKSLTWDSDHEGRVTRVVKRPGDKGYIVYVKTEEPIRVGDKICGRHGDKNIIGAIVPDHQMPRIGGPDGKPLDLITSYSGVVSRINIGQLMELSASKIANKTGQPYVVQNFQPGVDYSERLRKEIKEHGLSDTDKIYDPVSQTYLENEVMTGHKYVMKLKHQVEKKESVRGMDQALARKFSVNEDPSRGGGEGAQAISQLDLYALLAHGARANLKEMSSYKAERQHNSETMADTDFWNRIMLGLPLQPPKPTFAYKKFEAMLTGMGINLKKEGHETILTPLTDKGTLHLSAGEINEAKSLRGKDDTEIEGGIFDPKTTGGLKGQKWSHIKLAEPFPNPLFVGSEKLPGPAVVLSGLKFKEFEEVVKAKKPINVNGKELTGGKAIEELLKNVNVKKELKELVPRLKDLKGSDLDKANKKAKFLNALDKVGMTPHEAYIVNNMPIVPPVFRPITLMPDNTLASADINDLYLKLIQDNNALKDKEVLTYNPELHKKLQEAVYDKLKSVVGIGSVPTYDGNRKLKGLAQTVAGDSPKTGFFQNKIMKRRQELSMRSTITPAPDLQMDQVGLPKDAAMELYKPFVIRELVRAGKDLIEATKEVKESSPIAWKALDQAIKDRPVLLKRDPVLHKYNMQAYFPILKEGQSIGLHPLSCAGYNSDFDGDTMAVYLPLTEEAKREAIEKMLPSKNLFSTTNYGIMHAPDQEAVVGLHLASQWGEKTNKTYNTIQDVLKDKTLHRNDVVKVKIGPHFHETTQGRLQINSLLPISFPNDEREKLLHDPSFNFKKGSIHDFLEKAAKSDPKDHSKLVDGWRTYGNEVSFKSGFSFSLNDLKPLKEQREKILKPYKEEEERIKASTLHQDDKDRKIVDLYSKATVELDKELGKEYEKSGNRIKKCVDIKARGSQAQFRQTVIAPMLLVDTNNKVIPNPVTKSYAEGLSLDQYWTALHGARMGVLSRAQGTSQPGAMAKEIVNLNIPTVIASHDCGTKKGAVIPLIDSKGKEEIDITDRILAKDITEPGFQLKAGTMITPEHFAHMKKVGLKEVEVRSPLKCQDTVGVCKLCVGNSPEGRLHEIGTNIGIIASHAISEPAIQLAMDQFHQGGSATARGSTEASGLKRAQQLLNLPKNLPGSAILAKTNGQITSIDKDPSTNGHNIHIKSDTNTHIHYLPPDKRVLVNVGDEIHKGNPLSNGSINPHQLLQLKNMDAVRDYLTNELSSIYKSVGGTRRRNIELVVRNLTNLTEVVDSGGSEHLPGDVVPNSKVQSFNSTVKKPEDRIIHKPILKGIKEAALLKDEDYLSRMNFQRIQSTLVEGAGKGWRTKTKDTTNPIAPWAASSIGPQIDKNKPHY